MTKTLKLSAAQKYAVVCPSCGAAVNKSCRKMTGRVGAAYRMHPARVAAAEAALAAVAPGIPVLWMWNWTSGGYNSCLAPSRWVALHKAEAMAKHTTLVVNEQTLRIVSQADVDAEDRKHAGLFD